MDSACGCQALASKAARPSARPMNSASKPLRSVPHISDLHATILHLLGLDHTRLTYFYQGLNQRLTGVRGNVIQKVLG
jgi:hypothetical protein